MHNIALVLTLLLTRGEQYVPTPDGWLVQPTAELVTLFRPYRIGWRVPIRQLRQRVEY